MLSDQHLLFLEVLTYVWYHARHFTLIQQVVPELPMMSQACFPTFPGTSTVNKTDKPLSWWSSHVYNERQAP